VKNHGIDPDKEGEMSEQHNVQIVQECYAAILRGDIQALLNAMSEDVEWQLPGPNDMPWAGLNRGREQVARWWAIVGETCDVEQFEPREYIAHGDKVVVLGYDRVHVKVTGRTWENNWADVWTLHEGKVVSFRAYEDTAAIVAAVRNP
jgi:hypothetical protein